VGPSGAGKDTLIDGARRQLAGCSGITFATRVVTRPATAFEAHDSMGEQDFNNAEAQGAFCLSWSAHGLAYGLPASLDDRLLSGEIVVANVSRAIVAAARRRFAEVRVVYITAPAEVLAARRAARGREGAPTVIDSRVMRAAIDDERSAADLVIENVGPPQGGIALLSDFLVGLEARLS
jgi:ribose 1,5-bisphosphokinase